MWAADLLVQVVIVVWVVVVAHVVAAVLVLASVVVSWAVTVMLIGASLVNVMFVQAQACHCYLWPPETSQPSDLLHRVLNV